MLIRFLVGNFLSFNETQEFSMLQGKARRKEDHLYQNDKINLLRFAALYGANASGKSNLVNAFMISRDFIVNQDRYDLRTCFFRMQDSKENEPTYFEYEILINDRVFSYGFEIILAKQEFVSEWLIELYENGDTFNYFTRNIRNEEITTDLKTNNEELNIEFNVYQNNIRYENDILFLYELNRNKSSLYASNSEFGIIKDIYQWFLRGLEIQKPFDNRPNYSYINFTDKSKLLKILSSFNLGITDYEINDIPDDEVPDRLPKSVYSRIREDLEKIYKQKQESSEQTKIQATYIGSHGEMVFFRLDKNLQIKASEIVFDHEYEQTSCLFSPDEESDGTRRIIELISVLLSENNTFIIDEIDRSLHPKLTYQFIKDFFELTKGQKIQLITTTHEDRLLDFNLLRQDEIWIIEKSKDGSSRLYSLDEYNVRFDQKVDKAYLEGRYGGVPYFTLINK